jgi:hypothetical protein
VRLWLAERYVTRGRRRLTRSRRDRSRYPFVPWPAGHGRPHRRVGGPPSCRVGARSAAQSRRRNRASATREGLSIGATAHRRKAREPKLSGCLRPSGGRDDPTLATGNRFQQLNRNPRLRLSRTRISLLPAATAPEKVSAERPYVEKGRDRCSARSPGRPTLTALRIAHLAL